MTGEGQRVVSHFVIVSHFISLVGLHCENAHLSRPYRTWIQAYPPRFVFIARTALRFKMFTLSKHSMETVHSMIVVYVVKDISCFRIKGQTQSLVKNRSALLSPGEIYCSISVVAVAFRRPCLYTYR